MAPTSTCVGSSHRKGQGRVYNEERSRCLGGFAVAELVIGKVPEVFWLGGSRKEACAWKCGQNRLPELLMLKCIQADEPQRHLGHMYAQPWLLPVQQGLIKFLLTFPAREDQVCY